MGTTITPITYTGMVVAPDGFRVNLENLGTSNVAAGLVSSDGTYFQPTVLGGGLSYTITLGNAGTLTNSGVLTIGGANGTIALGTGLSIAGGTLNATGGTVTSVAASGGTTGLTFSGSPITSAGTVTLGGTLAIASGGTNGTATPTAGAIAYGTGSAYAFSAAGLAGQFLQSTGSGAPTWSTPSSGSFQPAYYGTFVSSINQTNGGATAANATVFDQTAAIANGVSMSLDANSKYTNITIANAGVYLIAFELAVTNSTGTNVPVNCWLAQNGNNIANTTSDFTISGGANQPQLINQQWIVNAAAGDKLQIYWACSATTVSLAYQAAAGSPTRPASPSAIVNVALIPASSSNLYVGSSTITGGTTGRVLFDNAGTLGEYSVTGTAGSVVLSNSPTLTTPNIGAATGTSLTLSGATTYGLDTNAITGSSGAVRFGAQQIVLWRNQAGSADLNMFQTDSSNNLNIGTGAGNVVINNTNTFTVGGTLKAQGGPIVAGVNSASNGTLQLLSSGATGSVTQFVPSTAFTPWNFTWPSTAGTSTQFLQTNGAGASTWASAVTSFQTSLSGLTPSVATNGAVTLAGNLALASGGTSVFGTGADGAVVISSGTTTLTRDMHYTNLTLSGTGSLRTNGFTVYCTGTLDISAAPAAALSASGTGGSAASGSTAGGLGISFQGITAPNGHNGASGPSGGTGAGANQSALLVNYGYGGDGGTGGSGGSASSGATLGGTGAAGTINSRIVGMPTTRPLPIIGYPTASSLGAGTLYGIWASMCGGAAGAGAGDGTNLGGGAGGMGYSAGAVVICANVINRGGSTAASAIQAIGGSGFAGGNVAAGNAGGGGGGAGTGGGLVMILAGSLAGSAATNAIDVSGGSGAAGGNGLGTGKGGSGGSGGNGGLYQILVFSPASFTTNTANTAGSAGGGAAAGTTGTAGGAGAIVRANL